MQKGEGGVESHLPVILMSRSQVNNHFEWWDAVRCTCVAPLPHQKKKDCGGVNLQQMRTTEMRTMTRRKEAAARLKRCHHPSTKSTHKSVRGGGEHKRDRFLGGESLAV